MNTGGLDREYVLHYYTPLGHRPRDRPTEIFMKRKDPFSGRVKVVPQMTYFRDLNRQPVPTHKLLEDDWRAYRKCVYVNARMARMEKLMGDYYTQHGMAARRRSLQNDQEQAPTAKPTRTCKCCSMTRTPQVLPKTTFSGPFQTMIPAPKCPTLRRRVGWQHQRHRKDTAHVATPRPYDANEERQRLLHPSFADSTSPPSTAMNTPRAGVPLDTISNVLNAMSPTV